MRPSGTVRASVGGRARQSRRDGGAGGGKRASMANYRTNRPTSVIRGRRSGTPRLPARMPHSGVLSGDQSIDQ